MRGPSKLDEESMSLNWLLEAREEVLGVGHPDAGEFGDTYAIRLVVGGLDRGDRKYGKRSSGELSGPFWLELPIFMCSALVLNCSCECLSFAIPCRFLVPDYR